MGRLGSMFFQQYAGEHSGTLSSQRARYFSQEMVETKAEPWRPNIGVMERTDMTGDKIKDKKYHLRKILSVIYERILGKV